MSSFSRTSIEAKSMSRAQPNSSVTWDSPGRETEVSREAMRMLARRGSYSIEKARHLLGYEPKIDLSEGMQRTERWLADRGLLAGSK